MKSFLLVILLMIPRENIKSIVNFKDLHSINDWSVVDDGVMGGRSKGMFALNSEGNGVFEGEVTTENNGGFSSVRHDFKSLDVSKYSSVIIRLKGDGKRYEFRIKNDTNERYSYIQYFETTGEWETIRLAFADFYPSFRGEKLNQPNYDGQKMEEVAFLIGNKKKEFFHLEIHTIQLQ